MNPLVEWLSRDHKSIRQIAREIGVSHAHVAKIFRGEAPVTWNFAASVALKTGLEPLEAFEMAGLLPKKN